MFCPNCGKELMEGAKFCHNCGHRFFAPSPSAPAGVEPAVIQDPGSVVAQTPRTSGMAIVSLVLGILGPFSGGLTGIIGLILGIKAYHKISRSQGQIRGIGMAIAGIVLGALAPHMFIGCLAGLAIPNILRFQTSAKQSEARQNLGAIFTAYAYYFSDNNTYPQAATITVAGNTYNCFTIADWEPKYPTRYAYECMGTVVFQNTEGPPIESCGEISGADNTSFIVAACGDIDDDETIDVWTINEQKVLRNIVNDAKE